MNARREREWGCLQALVFLFAIYIVAIWASCARCS
jgi:hypothetical protein